VGAESLAIGSEHTAVGDGTSCVDLMEGDVEDEELMRRKAENMHMKMCYLPLK
jgi:hypothetical protein